MPGPFPGMDPYLESPEFWRGFHNGLIYCINAALNASLPEGYAAHMEARLYVMMPQDRIYPDVGILQSAPRERVSGGAMLAERGADTSEIAIAYPEQIEEPFIEIRTIGRPRRVVTVIELLSPANKTQSSVGQKEYRQKQRDILNSDVHLLEIDLLRQGTHSVAVPVEEVTAKGRWDYLVSLHRAVEPYKYEFWRNSVRQSLPHVWIPLADADPDSVLDIQAALNQCYDSSRYREEIDYTAVPVPPLEGEDGDWADALLREKGLRS